MIRLWQRRRDLTLSEQRTAMAELFARELPNHPHQKPRVIWSEPDQRYALLSRIEQLHLRMSARFQAKRRERRSA